MEKSLDEIIAGKSAESRRKNERGRRSGRSGGRGKRNGPIKTRSGESRGSCVLVTNVSTDISEDDLTGLFRSAGPITTCTMERDNKKGVSIAWILYEFAADAAVAVGRYNNRAAAGKMISVRQVERVGDLSSQSSLKDRLGGSKKKTGRGRRGGEKKLEKKPKTQEELDAELDSYMAVDAEGAAPNAETTGAPVETAPTSAAATTTAAPAVEAAPAAVPDDLMIE